MKRILVFLLCLLAVFTIVSCNQEPEEQKGNGSGSGSGSMYYHLVATREAKRFSFLYADLAPEVGDELTFDYRSDHPVTHLYLRDGSGNGTISKVEIDDYISEPDGDGWISFTFVFDEAFDGILLELANYTSGDHDDGLGKFQPDDYLDIKNLSLSGEELEIEEADEENNYQSTHGVWNRAENQDQVLPTLEIKYL